jgi:hypothetical protein
MMVMLVDVLWALLALTTLYALWQAMYSMIRLRLGQHRFGVLHRSEKRVQALTPEHPFEAPLFQPSTPVEVSVSANSDKVTFVAVIHTPSPARFTRYRTEVS